MCIKGDPCFTQFVPGIYCDQTTQNVEHLSSEGCRTKKTLQGEFFQDFQIDRKRSIRNEVEANQFINLICFIEQVSTATVTTGFVV